MQNSIQKRLENDRKDLLDLSLRNPLISFRLLKTTGVQIVNEQSQFLFEALMSGNKKFQFVDNGKNKVHEIEIPQEAEESQGDEMSGGRNFQFSDNKKEKVGGVGQVQHSVQSAQKGNSDYKLQTNETASALLKRLLKTYNDANTYIQEKGINILYLTLGVLKWYEAENSEEARIAPLVLVPVELERQNSNEKFKLNYTKADVASNLSLQEKLKAEFGIKIPLLTEIESTDIEKYFDAVEQEIKGKKSWEIYRNNIYLGFFSFGKLLLFHDLDNNKWPDEAKPINHPLLRALLDTGFLDKEPSVGDDEFLDNNKDVANLFQVIDADSTQVQAMLAVDEGRNLVIQGPPGTGKSQTITNIIANAIGKGKKVLFVAEKLAALEVVKRRLDQSQLGEACLELHSHKANKKDVLKELQYTLDLGKPNTKNNESALLQSERIKTLNSYCNAVNEPIGKSGKSPFEIMGSLYKQQLEIDPSSLKTLHIKDLANCDSLWLSRAINMSNQIQSWIQNNSIPCSLPFWGSELRDFLPTELRGIDDLILNAIDSFKNLHESLKKICDKYKIRTPKDISGIEQCLVLFEMASKAPSLEDTQVENTTWLDQKQDINSVIQKGKNANALHAIYFERLIPEAWLADYSSVRFEITKHGKKFWRFIIKSYRNAVKIIIDWCNTNPPTNYNERLKLVDDLIQYRALNDYVSASSKDMQLYFPRSWKGKDSNWDTLHERAEYMASVYKAITTGVISRDILNVIQTINSLDAQKAYDTIENLNTSYKSALEKLLQRIQYKTPQNIQESTPVETWNFTEQFGLLESWKGNGAALQKIVSWNIIKDVAIDNGLNFLIEESAMWPDASKFLTESLRKTWLEHYYQKALIERTSLKRFDTDIHTNILEKFREEDNQVQEHCRTRVMEAHYRGLPHRNGSGQVATLIQEFNKKARHKPIRKLISEAGTAIQAIKPVFMMSPLSVANFIAPGTISFDLVIFDEASQVRPVDAYGAILRGKQLVVVGDTKQLPPTSFFDKMLMDESIDEEDENYSITSDIDSILSLCKAQRAPERMLRWHYRSKHESLITVSNFEFYDNRLVVFPSPGDTGFYGLKLHLLSHTAYDRGKTRTNKLEAEEVAKAVISHASKYPNKSLGVVAFSEAQKNAVMDAIEQKRKMNKNLESFFSKTQKEPFFVKNLESVQGDERDVIMISVGYGKNQDGYTTMSFGPLNNEGGEKRLNVLITRAKERCEVFTNLSFEDIDLNRAKGIGVKAFKSFLKYAECGILDMPQESGKEADSPFEEAVCNQLTGLGYKVHKQVGSNGFFIDLAVEDELKPGKYIIGIECDGAAYHSSRSARDRDLLRQNSLENMGWKIYRIWSTDWFKYPDKELKKLVEAIEKAKLGGVIQKNPEEKRLSQIQRDIAPETEKNNNQTNISNPQYSQNNGSKLINRVKTDNIISTLPDYTIAKLPDSIKTDRDKFHLHAKSDLAVWLVKVVNIESPIHIDEAERRIANAAGISKVGNRIKIAIIESVLFAIKTYHIRKHGDFLWSANMLKPVARNRANLPTSSKKIQFIAPEEIRIVLIKISEESVAIDEHSLIATCARKFGFFRLTDDIKGTIHKELQHTLKIKLLIKDGVWIKLP